MRGFHWFACALGLLLASCPEHPSEPHESPEFPAEGRRDGPPWFREVAAERGLVFTHRRGDAVRYDFPEIMGGGVALFDADDDGDLDAYLVQSGDLRRVLADGTQPSRNALFENDGSGGFRDVSEVSGADDAGYGMGVAAGDYDGDGDTDLYVTNVGANRLLRNEGGLRFTDVTEAACVGDEGWGTSAAFFDADGDGDLDLFVTNYIAWSVAAEIDCSGPTGRDYCSPGSYGAPAPDVLYENLGDGRFRDVSRAAGLGSAFGNGLGVTVGDFDSDGRLDLYVANDMMPNQLWLNDGGLRFHDDALLAGCAANRDGESEAGMGALAFDLEGDGDLDLFLTHLREETNTLYVNEGGLFRDRTVAFGLAGASVAHTGFGVVLGDFDEDGLADLYVANGAVTRNRPPLVEADPYAEPDLLFRGLARGGFEPVSPSGGTTPTLVTTSRGCAAGDLDGDGDLDLLVVDSGGPARLLLNEVATGGSLRLDVLDAGGGSAGALGAVVRVRLGDLTGTAVVQPARGYCSSQPTTLHLGLGGRRGRAVVRVRWPNGTEESFEVDAPGRATLRAGTGH